MGRALITGATAGLGLEFAWQLAAERHHLVLVARDAERLGVIAHQLRSAAGIDVEVLPADLAVAGDLARVADRLASARAPIGLLVNNAGFGLRQRFHTGSLDVERRALSVMVEAVMVLSHAAAGAMALRGRGAICNVSSVAALMAGGTYSAHKAWVRTFTEALANDLAGTGVTTMALCPGFVRTEFHQRAELRVEDIPGAMFLSAPDVVAKALADIRRGVVISTPSVRYRLFSGLLRAMPRSLVRALERPRRSLGILRP